MSHLFDISVSIGANDFIYIDFACDLKSKSLFIP